MRKWIIKKKVKIKSKLGIFNKHWTINSGIFVIMKVLEKLSITLAKLIYLQFTRY